MSKDDNLQLRSKNTIAFEGWGNLFFMAVGIIFVLLSEPRNLSSNNISKYIFLTLGVTFLSNSIYNLIRFKCVSKDENILHRKAITLFDQLKLPKDKCGLVNIFNENNKVIDEIKLELRKIYQSHNNYEDKNICDIICNGNIAGFMGETELDNIRNDIISYLLKGLSVRVIISNYNLNYLAQLYIDSTFSLDVKNMDFPFSSAYAKIKDDILNLIGTFDGIMQHHDMIKKNVGRVDIKFTNCLPALQYHRIGNKVFVSSRMIGGEYKLAPIVHEYEKTDDQDNAFHLYEGFFNNLWENTSFSWYDKNLSPHSNGNLPINPNYIINPHLVIGDVVIDKIMRMTCSTLIMILRIVNDKKIPQNEQPVRAFFTINNCTPRNTDDVIRRYNVHAVDRKKGVANLESINNPSEGKALGYEVNSHHAIGAAITTGKTIFRTINTDYEPSDWHISNEDWGKTVVSLSVPINANIEESAYMSIQYYSDKKKGGEGFKILRGNTKTIATLTFEFSEETQELFGIPTDEIETPEYNINITKVDSNRRILHEATDCAGLIIEYLGLDASVGHAE